MQSALLVLSIVAAFLLACPNARAKFNCFKTPQGEHRCACVGAMIAAKCKNRTAAKRALNAIIASLALLSAAARRRGLHERVLERAAERV